MPGEDIQSWSITAATNATADTLINWAEGQPRASVNNSARSMMAATAKDRNLKNGSITTGGTANVQTFTSGVTYTVVPTGLTVRLKIGVTNTGPATLNMDGIGDVAIKDQAGNDIFAGALALGQYADFLYNGTNWILLSANAAAASFDALAYNGMQVNGSGDVDQALSGNVTPASATVPYFTDNWRVSKNGAVAVLASASPITSVAVALPGFANAVRVYTTTPLATMVTTDVVYMTTHIEGYRAARLGWGAAGAQSVSIAFWVYVSGSVSMPATMTVMITNDDNSRSYRTNVVVNAVATWEYKTVTIPGDVTGTWNKTNVNGMRLYFCTGVGPAGQAAANAWSGLPGAGTTSTSNFHTVGGNQVCITGLVVLPGAVLPSAAQSPSIMRSVDQELQICQRYYEKSYDYATAVGTVTNTGMWEGYIVTGAGNYQARGVTFLMRKRAAPTVIGYNPSTGAPGQAVGIAQGPVSANFDGVGESGFNWFFGAASSDLFRVHWIADARL